MISKCLCQNRSPDAPGADLVRGQAGVVYLRQIGPRHPAGRRQPGGDGGRSADSSRILEPAGRCRRRAGGPGDAS